MLRIIIIKELLENIKSYKFIIILFACVFLLGFSNFEMYKHYKDNVQSRSFNQLNENEYYLSKAPNVLSIYVHGTQEILERVFVYNRDESSIFELNFGINLDFYRQLFSILDFTYVVRVIFSFLALIIGFDLISGERKKGTLKLILSNSVSRDTLIFGKLIGNYLVLAIPFCMSFLLFYIILSLMGDVHFGLQDNLRLLLLLIVSLIYIALFFFISVYISTKSNSSKTSITYCFLVWLILVFFVPNISSIVTKISTPIANESLIEERKLDNKNKIQLENPDKAEEWIADEIYRQEKAIVYDFRNKISKQVNNIKFINGFGPAGAFTLFSSNIANYGFEDERHFYNSLIRYVDDNRNKNEIETFIYSDLDLSTSLTNSKVELICIIIYLLIFYLLIYYSFPKYDVR